MRTIQCSTNLLPPLKIYLPLVDIAKHKAFDILTTICRLAIVNVCVIIILSIGNTQISVLLLCFLYLFEELMITMHENVLFKPSDVMMTR